MLHLLWGSNRSEYRTAGVLTVTRWLDGGRRKVFIDQYGVRVYYENRERIFEYK